ncbi:helix-turn-helix transcriptional regulator [Streptomyces tropicalis]|uniref:WYL domain-containing protein n=1 Tax=Streptomyces tropicalis TaxID=3034234 RepID=A0ABT6A6J3_9ACTN|nr:WYL domain-containing protein [Streptomyces tropicalis]MDF3300248.1 WYL domain-containing protein [Streptomyces tropicalis]
MRAARLLSLILLLQNRGRLTAGELADELGVSVRTVYRDVESLSGAGIPVYGDAGHGGGYQLLGGYRTRLTGLHADEAESLFLAGLPGAAADLGLGEVLAAAQLKLAAALPGPLRDRAGRIRERFHLDALGWYREQDSPAALAPLADAVWNQRRIRVRYRRWAAPQEVDRELDPYGLVLKAGVWYLVAAADGAVRTYRVSSVLRLEVGEDGFERPPGFDLAAHWRDYLGAYDARRLRLQVCVRIAPALLSALPDRLDAALVRAVEASAGPPDADGWVRAVVPMESVDQAVPVLLSLGPEIEVLAPDELRRRIAERAAAVLGLYRPSAVRGPGAPGVREAAGVGEAAEDGAGARSSSPAHAVDSSARAARTAKP